MESSNAKNRRDTKEAPRSFEMIEEGTGSQEGLEYEKLLEVDLASDPVKKVLPASIVSRTGFMVLVLLAVQNCSKNLLMRYVMKDSPKFFTSAAVLASEFIKLTLSVLYIVTIDKKSIPSIFQYLKDDMQNTLLLVVPASAYNLQMSLEYVALANLDAATFSVLVQTKLLLTATFAAFVQKKKLKYIQIISLVLLTVGVMLCNMPSKAKAAAGSCPCGVGPKAAPAAKRRADGIDSAAHGTNRAIL
jgi:uncharacterized membrane protein